MAKSAKHNFIISIGDTGSILTLLHGGKVKDRVFASTPIDDVIIAKLQSNKDAPIKVFIDISEQGFQNISLPPVSSSNLKKLLENRIKKEYGEGNLTAHLPIKGEGKKTKNFLIAAVNTSEPYGRWLDVLGEQKNKLEGIYLLPLEAHHMAEKLKSKKSQDWQVLVLLNKLSDIRISVFHKGNLVVTRNAKANDSSDENIAKSIENETGNTVEYVRRMGFEEKDKLDIISISPKEVAENLKFAMPYAASTQVLTPASASIKLGLKDYPAKDDKFADVLSAVYFASKVKKPILSLATVTQKKQASNANAVKLAMIIGCIICAILAWGIFSNIMAANEQKDKLEAAISKKKKLTKQLKNFSSDEAQTNEKFNVAAKEMVTVSEKLQDSKTLSLDILSRLKNVDFSEKYISRIDAYTDHIPAGKKVRIDLSVNIKKKDKDLARMLDYIEGFINQIKQALPEYTITNDDYKNSILSGNILQSGNNNDRIIKITISGTHK